MIIIDGIERLAYVPKVILTGGPGSGKTTTLNALRELRPVIEEAARDMIKQHGFSPNLQKLIYDEALRRVMSAPEGAILDRSHIDCMAYGYVPDEIPPPIKDAEVWWLKNHREFYRNDAERKETFEEAEAFGKKLRDTYLSLGVLRPRNRHQGPDDMARVGVEEPGEGHCLQDKRRAVGQVRAVEDRAVYFPGP